MIRRKLYFQHKENAVGSALPPETPLTNAQETLKRAKELNDDPVPTLRHDFLRRRNILCLWCKANKLVEGIRGASSTLTPRRLCLRATLTKLEMRRRNLRGNVCGHSRALPQYGEAKDHFQKVVTNGVTIGNTQKGKELQLHHRKRGLGPGRSRKSPIRKPNRTGLRSLGTHPRRKISNSEALWTS